ncbi:putative N-terminal domain protein [Rosellinia necatrix]|uniref:Putative N-terminal domain protein n=1 Tax=Rosellinia necatrix TaxID=77044 RepID=A0A1W2TTA5_ROSNE|nr:putative N-terminal domain protein [Rosellinia necatrix]
MLNLPECATALQGQGFTVVLYDPRNTGQSGGPPRDEIDPTQAVSDISDALTYLMALPSVDSKLVELFGISFGGTVALSASALGTMVRFTIAVAPVMDLDFISPAHRERVMHKCVQNRESQTLGNEPYTIPLVNEQGENVAGLGHGYDADKYKRLLQADLEVAPGHVNRITIMTYYKVSMWTPWPLWESLGSLEGKTSEKRGYDFGFMFIVPTADQVSYPEKQRLYFGQSGTKTWRKTKLEVECAGYEDALGELYIDKVVEGIQEFLQELQGL